MEKTWKPTVAGILTIISGAFQIIPGIVIATIGGFAGIFAGIPWLSAIGAPLIVFGTIAIVGCIFALRREAWGLGPGACRRHIRTHWSVVYSRTTRHHIRQLGKG
jgi:hypothetical protein